MVLNSDSNTAKYAAVPVLPELGGKLKMTMATLRWARSERRKSTNLPTRADNMAVRSVQVNMSCCLCC